jgi:hypothetical protein
MEIVMEWLASGYVTNLLLLILIVLVYTLNKYAHDIEYKFETHLVNLVNDIRYMQRTQK